MIHLLDRPQSKYGRVHNVGPIQQNKNKLFIYWNKLTDLADLRDVVAHKIQNFEPHHAVYTFGQLIIIELYVLVSLVPDHSVFDRVTIYYTIHFLDDIVMYTDDFDLLRYLLLEQYDLSIDFSN
jgi:hypothetical protein